MEAWSNREQNWEQTDIKFDMFFFFANKQVKDGLLLLIFFIFVLVPNLP